MSVKTTTLSAFVMAFILLLLRSGVTPVEAKQVRDWFVWCESDLVCTMQTDNSEQGIYGFGFIRGPKARAIAVPFLSRRYELVPGSKISLVLDNNTAQSFEFDLAMAEQDKGVWKFPDQQTDNTLVKAVMAARTMVLTLETPTERKTVSLSVSGATGSALYLDEAQARLGNTDALKSVGEGPATDAVSRVTRLGSADELPPPVRLAWQANDGECSEDYDGGDLIERFGGERISGEDRAFLFILPCGGPGAYNLPAAAYIFDEAENRARRIFFPTMSRDGPTLNETAINTSWDHVGNTLNAYYKGRGLGDCGVASHWRWDGRAYAQLVLVEEFAKDECDGKDTDWPQVWPPQQ